MRAKEAVRLGATDDLPKPFDRAQILTVVWDTLTSLCVWIHDFSTPLRHTF